ncbi:metal ABC transporter permease [Ruicaihuangia caeni]|uniref:metal ABC transporter permease n=1 Tax=Ruicaihuangia caeni TaxID=3042517 RepID=UPI00338DB210
MKGTDVAVWQWLIEPFTLPFMARALIVLVMLGLAAGVLGPLVHLRRLEFLSDGLVHAVFPGVVVGFVIAGSPGLFIGGAIAAVIAAVALTLVSRRGEPGDVPVAVVLTSMFSIGVIIVSQQRGYAGQLSELLFGHVLTVTETDVWATGILVALALLLVLPALKDHVFRAFDPQAAEAAGYRLLPLDLFLNVAIALVVVAASRALGVLLMLALLIVPVAVARLLIGTIGALIAGSTLTALLGAWLGLAVTFVGSVHAGFDLPGSATVVLVLLVLLGVALAAYGIRRWWVRGTRGGRGAAAPPVSDWERLDSPIADRGARA